MDAVSIFSSKAIAARRNRLEKELSKALKKDELVLIFCGKPIQKPGGLDQTYPFLPHPDYFWLTGSRRSRGIVAYATELGWVDFYEPVTLEERLWEGGGENPRMGFAGEKPLSEFQAWFSTQKHSKVFSLGQPCSKQKALSRGVDPLEVMSLQESINRVRRMKDQEEVDLVKRAARMAHKGYELLKTFIRAGVTEREVQIAYETEVLKAGSHKFPYDTIVGSGVNAATLHAMPTSKKIQSGELILIDAGADLHDYCVDITRVFAADGIFSAQQQNIYDLVAAAQRRAIENCRVGVEWREVHFLAAQVIAKGLKDLNILVGDVDDLLESGAVSVFFPHGVGHMVGQRVRDVGPILGKEIKSICGVKLRTDFTLEDHMIMTAEPGVYFVPAIIERTKADNKFSGQINWSEVEKWKNFGGVRIEDDILITSRGPENLTI